jgi:hypothetical protein
MRQTVKSSIVLALGTTAIAALVWTIVADRRSQPYTVQRSALSGWTVVVSQGAEPWVIAAQPPAAMAASLLRQLAAASGVPLVPPDLTVLPLVTRSEYDDALQGVYGVESLIRMAHEAGIEESVFEPLCVARQIDSGRPPGELFYVAFSSPAFRDLRQALSPIEPEHGGVGVYDPAALMPLLPVARSGGDRWWPLSFDRRTDCQAPLLVN